MSEYRRDAAVTRLVRFAAGQPNQLTRDDAKAIMEEIGWFHHGVTPEDWRIMEGRLWVREQFENDPPIWRWADAQDAAKIVSSLTESK